MRFNIETDRANGPTWRLVGDDDRVIAWAGRTFVSLAYADQAAHDVRGHENVPAGGQVEVPAGGQIEVPAFRVVS
jgi:hypothetical protein